ncbi:hypothetical protein SAMN05216389_1443 [Oceanobacillus limi]|uniref:Uncharacterized protein n=1 Tax=Oceanobacillus limi TaxID=930131 RepID=A0A1I0HP66_9BACI|nr:hypothetical protein [Oceanobacillus limi]SET85862.1 hypothetical protein SAMN05216389_1443 [Oceanobacillus limi]
MREIHLEVMNMKVADHLSREQHKKLKRMKDYKKKRKRNEKVNWHDLMGMNRDTYKRGRGGAIRSNRK